MKTFLTYFLTFCMGLTVCFAQKKITLSEGFDQPSPGWNANSQSIIAKVENGRLVLTGKTSKTSLEVAKTFNFDVEEDFLIEAMIKLTKGSNKAGFGIFISETPKPNYTNWHYFLISGDKRYKLYYEGYQSRQPMDYKSWTKASGTIQPRHQSNLLTIEKKGTEVHFYINKKLVHTEYGNRIKGKTIGFALNGYMEVEVDYLSIQGAQKINLVKNAKQGFQKKKLGPGVNSEHADLLPIISYDGRTLYFVRRGDPNNIAGSDDIWYSTKGADGVWTEAKNIGAPLNNASSNFVISVTPDGNTLLVGNTYKPDGSGKGAGVSITRRTQKSWEVPQELIIDNQYNNSIYVTYDFSADRKVLISSVQREDSRGDNDLYVSFLTGPNTYSEPVNMGDVLNTPGPEGTPFIAADNKTLYFTSDGHNGYGSNDIFRSRRLDDTWTNWSTPENLGPDINTSGWDAYYRLPASGKNAFLVSDGDIYQIQVVESAQPDPVLLISGKTFNRRNREPIGTRISYIDPETKEEIEIAVSSSEDGTYKMVLPLGKKYTLIASAEGYSSDQRVVDVSTVSSYQEIERDFYLDPTQELLTKTVKLNNVFFEFNTATLIPESKAEMDRVVKTLRENPGLSIEIQGHTDSTGGDSYNDKLARERIATIMRYLTTRGISAFRLTTAGFGEKAPIADNSTEEGRERNRRVEFRIVEW